MTATVRRIATSRSGPRRSRQPQALERHLFGAREVGLAGRAAVDVVDLHHVPGRLVAGQLVLDEGLQRLAVDRRAAGDDGGDGFAEALVRHADHDAVLHAGKALHDLFDLFREDLLAAGVDADRAAA